MPLAIPVPGKIIAVGLNYRDHATEGGVPVPDVPMLFGHWPNALIGPGDPIVLPDPELDDQIDYEAELAVVIGERAKAIAPADALGVVAGYCAFNDVSARGLQRDAGGGQQTMGKSLDTFDPVGVMTPASELPNPQSLRIRTLVNGRVLQDGNTSDQIFPVAEIIAYLSRTITLEPGDLIATGTPAGVGVLRTPPVLLRPGDEVTIDIDGIQPLTNPVVAGV
ncbi:fumarylacetoacetate hydrolase family protein [Pseudonocardia sp. RS010]|uniref:fumarylacetoacetate hydrolase family protein n=1 Tax=Pseudonocardia sp. RS010 TaxID=3385979 RepID=UPI00399F939C